MIKESAEQAVKEAAESGIKNITREVIEGCLKYGLDDDQDQNSTNSSKLASLLGGVRVEAMACGSYTIKFKSGKTYHGKGDYDRALQSAKQRAEINGDAIESIDWSPSVDKNQSFIDEYNRMQSDSTNEIQEGYQNPNNYNQIQSPGKKLTNNSNN